MINSTDPNATDCQSETCHEVIIDTIDDECNKVLVCSWNDIVVVPFYDGIGTVFVATALFTRICLLIGLYKTMKKEPTYLYQVIFTLYDTIDVCCTGLFILFGIWLPRVDAYYRCYGCIWFGSKVIVAGYDFSVTNVLLMAVIVAADRLISMAAPLQYSKISGARFRISIAVCCFLISVVVNGFDWFLFGPEADGLGGWLLRQNVEVSVSPIGVVWVGLHNAILIAGLITLAVINYFMLKLHRKRLENLKRLRNDSKKDIARKRDEHTLIVITACQCLFVSLSVLSFIFYFAYGNYAVVNCSCIFTFVGMMTDTANMIVRLVDVPTYLAINKRFRGMFLDGFKTLFGFIFFAKWFSNRPVNSVDDRTSVQPFSTSLNRHQ